MSKQLTLLMNIKKHPTLKNIYVSDTGQVYENLSRKKGSSQSKDRSQATK